MVIDLETTKTIPVSVKETVAFFKKKKLWFILSKNIKSTSCRDAANNRFRLGHVGIPLQDELKSFFGKIIEGEKEKYLVIHCRGHQELDFGKALNLIESKGRIERLSAKELSEFSGTQYGTVNPFSLDPHIISKPILQVFDTSVNTHSSAPYTMMTNAGDLEWGIEFDPSELIKALPETKTIVGKVVVNDNQNIKAKKIGLITGNSPESGMFLWGLINEKIRLKLGNKFEGDVSYPTIHITSLPDLGFTMELKYREKIIWAKLEKCIKTFIEKGVSNLTIACNTTQYFNKKIVALCSRYDIKYYSIEDILKNYLDKNHIDQSDFIGIGYTVNKQWSGFNKILSRDDVTIPEKSILNKIDSIAYGVKQNGVTGKEINKFRDLINKQTESQNVIIALTEISILLNSQKKNKKNGKIFIDTMDILADSIVHDYLFNRFPSL